jgi:hypothetical protein
VGWFFPQRLHIETPSFIALMPPVSNIAWVHVFVVLPFRALHHCVAP